MSADNAKHVNKSQNYKKACYCFFCVISVIGGKILYFLPRILIYNNQFVDEDPEIEDSADIKESEEDAFKEYAFRFPEPESVFHWHS